MDTPYTLCTLPPDALRLIWERLTAHGEHHRKNLRLACRAIRATTTAFINSLTLDTSGAPATFEGVVSTAGHKLDAAPPGVGLTSLRWVVGGEGGVPRQAWPAALNTIFSRHGTLLASLTHLSLSVPPVSWKSRGEVAKAQCTRSTTQPNAPPPRPPPCTQSLSAGDIVILAAACPRLRTFEIDGSFDILGPLRFGTFTCLSGLGLRGVRGPLPLDTVQLGECLRAATTLTDVIICSGPPSDARRVRPASVLPHLRPLVGLRRLRLRLYPDAAPSQSEAAAASLEHLSVLTKVRTRGREGGHDEARHHLFTCPPPSGTS